MIELRDVTIRAGQFSLERVSFRIESGEYAVLMGRTGLGKTTILESICGLRSITSGAILIRETNVSDWSPGDREIGYVPQDLALFPTMTVEQHLAFALRLRKASEKIIAERVSELADVLGIRPLVKRRIQALSGGERQRVALGRALSFRPSVLVLDEPLSALDEQTRQEIYSLLRRIKETTRVTTLHVTHNLDDADALADRRFVLDQGKVLRIE
jgi:ABC-type sugar transport system ATPase subunit